MDSDLPDFDGPRYLRTGYTDQGRVSDRLLDAFLKELPGDGYLPLRWKNATAYSDRGTVLWSAAATVHTLVIGGTTVLRIRMDASNHCWIEGPTHVLPASQENIPEKNYKKSKPFSRRVKITTEADMCSIAKTVRLVYGV